MINLMFCFEWVHWRQQKFSYLKILLTFFCFVNEFFWKRFQWTTSCKLRDSLTETENICVFPWQINVCDTRPTSSAPTCCKQMTMMNPPWKILPILFSCPLRNQPDLNLALSQRRSHHLIDKRLHNPNQLQYKSWRKNLHIQFLYKSFHRIWHLC